MKMPHGTKFPLSLCPFFLLSIVLFFFFWWNFLFLYFLFYKLFLYLLMFVILFFWSITCRGMWERGRVGSNTPFYKCPVSLPTKLCRGAVILFFCHLGGGGGWGSNPTPTSNSQHFFSVKAQHYFFVNYVCYTFGLVLYHLGLLVFSYWARLFSFNCFGFRIFVKFNFYQGQIFDQKNLLDNFS